MKKLFILFASLAATFSLQAQYKLTKLWEAKDQLPVPESALYRAEHKDILVSLIDGAGNEKDGKGGVAILNKDGSIKNATWIQGLNAPKGMAINGDILYVADITEVVVIDVVSGNITNQIPVDGSVFLNDITVDRRGRVFVSDTRKNTIHLIEKGKASLYMDNVTDVNGLRVINDDLYVLAATELWKVDKNKNKTVMAKGFEQNGDGIEPVGNGDFIVTCWPGLIYHVKADGSIHKIQDVQGKMNTADLGYNKDDNVIYIPTFNNNSVIAYKLDN